VNGYQLTFARSARKELEALLASVVARAFPRIEALAHNPRPVGSRKLQGENNLWRIRVGEYRVIYSVDDRRRLIDTTAVRHRSEVYR
jgi:mRNA interferase RelE/StbE